MWGEGCWGDHPWAAGEDIGYYALNTTEAEVSFDFVLYVGTYEGATEPDDNPSSQPIRGILREPLRSYRRSIDGETIGQYAVGDGQIVLDNADGRLDALPLKYSVDGQPVHVQGRRRHIDRYDEAFIVFRGRARGMGVYERETVFYVVDNGYRLRRPAQPNIYGGTGGDDGGEDTAGQRKPLAFGPCKEFTPVLLIANQLIYQVHDGRVFDIPAVYDRAVPLGRGNDYATLAQLIAATTQKGFYDTCLARSCIKLGSPPNGTLTVDVDGAVVDGVYLTKTPDICLHLIRTVTDLVYPDDFDVASFAAVAAAQPATVAYCLSTDETLDVRDVVARLMGGIGGWIGFRRSGLCYASLFTAPAGTPVLRLGKNDLLGGADAISREELFSGVPPWRQQVPYARAWTTQTDPAPSVSPERRAFVARPYRLAIASDAGIIRDHPEARDADPVDAYFASQTDAQAEADRLLILNGTARYRYRFAIDRRGLLLDLGDLLELTLNRFDLHNGRLLRVIELKENFAMGEVGRVEVVAYG